MIYTCYDKIYTVPGIGRAPPGLPGPRAPPAWYQALPEQAQKACLLGALSWRETQLDRDQLFARDRYSIERISYVYKYELATQVEWIDNKQCLCFDLKARGKFTKDVWRKRWRRDSRRR
jgi:hypothetical protein